MPQHIGALSEVWRFPVKSMGGERLEAAEVTPYGVLGDRAYALIDAETGKVVSAKSVWLFPDLLNCRATFLEPPRSGEETAPVRITFPDETSVSSDAGDVDHVLSARLGKDVRLARAAPEDFVIDQYHPDVEGLDPAGHRDTVVEQRLGSAFFKQADIPSPLPVGSFLDLFPMSVITTSTLRRLGELQPASRFDPRRFRMNLIIETAVDGFIENGWIGRGLTVGGSVTLGVALPDPRCVMTTLAQEDLPKDDEIIRTLAVHNRLDVAGSGRFPCAGVYAVVVAPGPVRRGDAVTLA